MTDTPHSELLAGLRILDFTRVLAGPYCTALLADLGAEVIKIESANGDDYRHIGPFRNGESLLFQSINRGKKSVVLDLKSPDDINRVKQLVSEVDAVIENFRPGVMDRLGIGEQTLRALNPRLVYLSISGFGQTGPNTRNPAYDIIVQAMSGIMASTGEAQGEPTMIGDAIGDVAGGIFAAWALMTALFDRERNQRGRYVDVALYDSLLALMPTQACMAITADGNPQRSGNKHALSAPFGVYAAKGGHFAIAVLNDALFAKFCAVIGKPDIATDPRFASDELRRCNEKALAEKIECWGMQRSPAEVIDTLLDAGIPAGEICSSRQAWHSPQATSRAMFSSVSHARLGELSIFEQPAHFSDAPRGGRSAAPTLNQHYDELFPKN